MRMKIAMALLVLTAPFAWAKDLKGKQEMCAVQVAGQVPCDKINKSEPSERVTVERRDERPATNSDEVCIRRCLSDQAWARCETKSWFANMKGHPNAKPHGDKATRYSTARFFEQCGIDCRKRGTMRIGYQSPYTKEWTVFRYGHPED